MKAAPFKGATNKLYYDILFPMMKQLVLFFLRPGFQARVKVFLEPCSQFSKVRVGIPSNAERSDCVRPAASRAFRILLSMLYHPELRYYFYKLAYVMKMVKVLLYLTKVYNLFKAHISKRSYSAHPS